MNKKILIGSIISVVILILVSFTSVIGYNNVESNKILSPLFNIRSNRAIDEDSNDFTCDYVGKDREILITLPKRDDRAIEMKKAIDILTKMDGIAFNRFIKLSINRLYRDSTIRNDEIPKLIMALHQLKTNPENIRNELADITDKTLTQHWACTFNVEYFGCILFYIFIIMLYIILLLTGTADCQTMNCNMY